MAKDIFDSYLSEINEAYLRGDATEHTHRPALKGLIEALGDGITATNEPRRIECGAPDMLVSRRKRRLDQRVGYIECKDIGTDLKKEEKTEQLKRYIASHPNVILTDYIVFRWYHSGELKLTGRVAREGKGGAFEATEDGLRDVGELIGVFLQQEPERITTAKELATRMAGIAHLLQGVIGTAFMHEDTDGSLHGQFRAFREVLLHDLDIRQFADMYAQTIAYGLFTARCHIDDVTLYGKDRYATFHEIDSKSGEFTRERAAYMLPKTNPFLRKLFAHIAGPELDDRIAWLVDDLVALLRQADMGVILRDFARRKGRSDPVVHFYETFLAEYDPKLRKSRGVYYTPDEVVSYIVRGVDWLLKEKFGVKRGLADDSTIKTDKGDVHQLLILDPAVGTGTFLYEVIDLVYRRFGKQKGMWSGYVRDHLLPRLFGFELMMAPYAVAHMKLGLELAETGYDFESDERLGIYLTNTLEEAEETTRDLFAQWLSDEAREANKVKRDLPIMVVLGNPPYSYNSANTGEWTRSLVQDYYRVDGQALRERNPKGLQDDYVKFIRFGQWRIEQTGNGILALITNHSYLDNPTFRGMRKRLLDAFDAIYIIDLHGDLKKKEKCPDGSKDMNVFDIQPGVSIGFFIKRPELERKKRVFHADLYGLRKGKYAWLEENGIETTDWQLLDVKGPFWLFRPENRESMEEYERGTRLVELFPLNGVGITTARDHVVVGFEKKPLAQRAQFFRDSTDSDEEVRRRLKIPRKKGWDISNARSLIRQVGRIGNYLCPVSYRPFDLRWIFYHDSLVWRTVKKVMIHLLDKENCALCFLRRSREKTSTNFFVMRGIIDKTALTSVDNANVAPLYLYPNGIQADMDFESWPRGRSGRVPNLSRGFVEELGKRIKLEFVSDGRGNVLDSRLRGNDKEAVSDKGTFGPEDVFDYIYGVLHSPEYRRRYAEFLKIDFPRVPWPGGRGIFERVCKVGGELVKLHLMEHPVLEDDKRWPGYPVEGGNEVEKGYPKYVCHAEKANKGRVYINKDQYFEGVRQEVWEFHIGGYQVCEKWLKDRRGRKLSYDDIRHYQRIVVALGETIRLMNSRCLVEMFD